MSSFIQEDVTVKIVNASKIIVNVIWVKLDALFFANVKIAIIKNHKLAKPKKLTFKRIPRERKEEVMLMKLSNQKLFLKTSPLVNNF